MYETNERNAATINRPSGQACSSRAKFVQGENVNVGVSWEMLCHSDCKQTAGGSFVWKSAAAYRGKVDAG